MWYMWEGNHFYCSTKETVSFPPMYFILLLWPHGGIHYLGYYTDKSVELLKSMCNTRGSVISVDIFYRELIVVIDFV